MTIGQGVFSLARMMKTKATRGRKILRDRRKEMGLTLPELGAAVGDPDGGQIGKFERGADGRALPLALATRVSAHTGVPLISLLNPSQRQVARKIVALMERDSAAA